MSSRSDGPGFVPYDDGEGEWESEGQGRSPVFERAAGDGRRRLGRSVTPRLVLGLVLLALLAVAAWWGVQTILLPPVATPTPTPMVTVAILPPPTSAPEPAETIAIATIAPSPTPPPATGDIRVGEQVQVTGTGAEGIRFRSGPGKDYLTLAILLDGTELLVLDGPEEGDGFAWWRLEMEDGTVGWAADDWLQPSPGAE